MGKRRGYKLHRDAFEDVLRLSATTPADTARRADMHISTLSGLIHGRSNASPPAAKQLADALGVRVTTLFPEVAGFDMPGGGARTTPTEVAS